MCLLLLFDALRCLTQDFRVIQRATTLSLRQRAARYFSRCFPLGWESPRCVLRPGGGPPPVTQQFSFRLGVRTFLSAWGARTGIYAQARRATNPPSGQECLRSDPDARCPGRRALGPEREGLADDFVQLGFGVAAAEGEGIGHDIELGLRRDASALGCVVPPTPECARDDHLPPAEGGGLAGFASFGHFAPK